MRRRVGRHFPVCPHQRIEAGIAIALFEAQAFGPIVLHGNPRVGLDAEVRNAEQDGVSPSAREATPLCAAIKELRPTRRAAERVR